MLDGWFCTGVFGICLLGVGLSFDVMCLMCEDSTREVVADQDVYYELSRSFEWGVARLCTSVNHDLPPIE
jgi:hypothetical protein